MARIEINNLTEQDKNDIEEYFNSPDYLFGSDDLNHWLKIVDEIVARHKAEPFARVDAQLNEETDGT